jgi:hypothetical protein
MAVVKIELNPAGVRELLRSPEVLADLSARAHRIANAAGDGMEVDAELGRVRARATVFTATFEAMRAEATTRALTRAVDAGR